MKRKLFAASCIVTVCICGHVSAESKNVTLDDCIKIAMDNHPDIMVSAEEQNKAVAGYTAAKSLNKMNIYGEAKTVEYLKPKSSTSTFNVPGKDTSIGLFAGATVSYSLYDATKSRKENLARMNIDLSRMNDIKVRSGIMLNVKTTYYAYAFARENTRLKEELKNQYQIKLEKTQMFLKNGQRPVIDVTKAEVDLASAVLEYEKAKNQENMAKAELLSALGIFDEDIEISPQAVSELPKVRYSLAELYTLAEHNSPDIRITRLTREIQKVNIDVEKAARNLSVDVIAAFGLENKNMTGQSAEENMKSENWKPTFHAGFQARFPIYTAGGITAKINAATADYNKSVYNEKKILINIKSMIRTYLQGMRELSKQLELSTLMRKNAENHLTLARKSYEMGIGTQLALQDAETARIDAELFYQKARYDYLLTLSKLSGTIGLGEEYLCEK